jgi:multicomponent Na+:H+ antiporter subunit G
VAAVGFVRLPDIFCRLHVTGIIDTLGAPLLLLGAALALGPTLAAGKLLLGLVFLFVTSPLVGHLLSRAALESRRATLLTEQAGKRTEPTRPNQDYSEVAA